MQLIIGLGNPGRAYTGTRHNVGFEVIDRLAARLGWVARPDEFDRLARSRFHGQAMDGVMSLLRPPPEDPAQPSVARAPHPDSAHAARPAPDVSPRRLLLLKPMTYMNRSGEAVRAAMEFYRLQLRELLVVLDDLALPAGRIRLRAGGSSGGHNGLRDIERAIGTSDYPRLRIGIDPPPQFLPGKDYVLGRFTEAQRQAVEPALDRAVEAVLLWIEQGTEPAMNRFNSSC